MAYELAKRISNMRAARRLGITESEFLRLIAGYLRRNRACRNVDNLLGGGMKRAEAAELFTAEVRALQGIYPDGHKRLRNWGAWSRDRSGIFPTLSPPGLWAEAICSKFDDFADEGDLKKAEEDKRYVTQTGDGKSERAETEPYDEKEANELDDFLHKRFPWNVRKCLMVAYVTLELPENQFPHHACCTHPTFLANLSLVLSEVER